MLILNILNLSFRLPFRIGIYEKKNYHCADYLMFNNAVNFIPDEIALLVCFGFEPLTLGRVDFLDSYPSLSLPSDGRIS